jgi:hypothetical protein
MPTCRVSSPGQITEKPKELENRDRPIKAGQSLELPWTAMLAVVPRYEFQYLTSVTTGVRSLMSALQRTNTMNEAKLGSRFTFPGTSLTVQRIGYGAMQLAGPGVWGPPKDPDGAVALLREAVATGVNHIDTSDFYGPHVTNQIIRQPCTRTRQDW